MNKIYRIIWSKVTGAMTVVSELAKTNGKSSMTVEGSGVAINAPSRTNFKLIKLSVALVAAIGLSTQAFAGKVEVGGGVAADGSTAVGSKNNQASGDQSIAIGDDTHATGDSSIAIGNDDTNRLTDGTDKIDYIFEGKLKHDKVGQALIDLTGKNLNDPSKYIPTESKGHGSVAIGVKAYSGAALSATYGTGAYVTDGAVLGLAFGAGSYVDKQNGVSLGAGSKTDGSAVYVPKSVIQTLDDQGNPTGTTETYNKFAGGGDTMLEGDQVSVGSIGFERQIKNLAPGRIAADSTDAINGSQLFSVTGRQQHRIAKLEEGNIDTYFHFNDPSMTQKAGDATTNLGGIKDKAGATGKWAITAGLNAKAKGQGGVALGYDSEAIGSGQYASVAIGDQAKSLGNGTIAIGERAIVDAGKWEGIAIGSRTKVSEHEGIAIGSDVEAGGERAIIIGQQAGLRDANSVYQIPNSSEGAFSVAIGSGSKRFAETQYAANANGDYSIVMGTDARSEVGANEGVAIGRASRVAAAQGIAIGGGSIDKGNDLAVKEPSRQGAIVSAEKGIAIGNASKVEGIRGIAIGSEALASGVESISIGKGNTVSGDHSGAIGDPSTVSGMNSYSVGNNNHIAVDKTFVVGNKVTATQENAVILGDSSTDRKFTTETSATVGPTTYNGFAGTPTGIVSVGAEGKERQIINVAPGKISADSTDAINGSQLYAVADKAGKGLVLSHSNIGGGEDATPNNNDFDLGAGEKLTIDAGKNIKISQSDGTISIATTDDVATKTDLAEVTKDLTENINEVKEDVAKDIQDVKDDITDLDTKVDKEVKDLEDKIDDEIDDVKDDITKLDDKIDKEVDDLEDKIDDEIDDVKDDVAKDIKELKDDVADDIKDIDDKVTEFGEHEISLGSDDGETNAQQLDQKKIKFDVVGDGKYTETEASGSRVKVKLTKETTDKIDKIDDIEDSVDDLKNVKIKLGSDNGDTNEQALTGNIKFDIVGEDGIETEANGDKIKVKLDPTTKDKIDNAADKNLSNITDEGKKNITKLGTIVEAEDNSVTVTPETDATTGQKTFKVKVSTTPLVTDDATGQVTKPAGADANKIATAGDVAEAINSSFWKTTAKTGVDGGVVKGATDRKIKAGQEVNFDAGKNMELTQTADGYVYATKDEVEFDKVTTDELKAGPVTINNDGIDAGDKQIKNVASAGDINDAANAGNAVNAGDVSKALKAAAVKVDTDTPDLVTIAKENPNAEGGTTYKVNIQTTPLTPNTADGTVNAPANPNSLATAGDVANAVNNVVANAGWELQERGAKKDKVTSGNIVDFIDGAGTTVTVDNSVTDNTKIKYDIKLNSDTMKLDSNGNVTVNTTPLVDANDDGKVDTPANPNAVATAGSVADAINNANHKVAGKNSDKQFDAEDGEATIKTGETLEIEAGKNLVLKTDAGNKKLQLSTAKEVAFDKVTVGGVVLDKDAGIDAGGKEIKNVAAGTTDDAGVNLKQLKDNAQSIANALGGGSTVNPDGSVTAPTFEVIDPVTGNNTAPATVADAVKNLSDAVNNPLYVKADVLDGTGKEKSSEQKLGSTLEILTDKTSDGTSGDNLETKVEDGKVTISMKDKPYFEEIQAGKKDNPISIGAKDGKNVISGLDSTLPTGDTNAAAPTLTDDQKGQAATLGDVLNTGWNLQEDGNARDLVKAYDTVNFVDTDTVENTIVTTDNKVSEIKFNVKTTQLTTNDTTGEVVAPTGDDAKKLVNAGDVANAISKSGFVLTAEGKEGSVVNPGETVDMKNTDGNIIISKVADNNDVNYDLAKELKGLTSVETVDADGNTTVQNGAGVTITPKDASKKPVSLTKDGLDNGDNKITGVAKGDVNANSTDAVNGAQLFELAEKPISFVGNGTDADKITKKLGETLTIKGGLANDDEASDTNTFVKEDNGELIVKISDKPVFEEVTAKDGLTIGEGPDAINMAPSKTKTVGGQSTPAVDMGGKTFTGLASNLPDSNTTKGEKPANLETSNAATLGDVMNAGWNLQVEGADADFVKPYDTVNFKAKADSGITVEETADSTDGKTTIEIGLSKGSVSSNTDGVAEAGKPDGFVTGSQVADAINNSGFKLDIAATADGEEGTNVTTQAEDELIKNGQKVTVEADKNIKISQAKGKITVATKDEVSFDSVAITNGPTLNATGIDMGDKPITGLASAGDINDPANEKNAVNAGDLKKAAAAAKTTVESLDTDKITAEPKIQPDGSTKYELNIVTSTIPTNTDGTVGAPANPNALVTAGDVANAVKNAGWNLRENGAPRDLVTAGNIVDFVDNPDGATTVAIESTETESKVKVSVVVDDETVQIKDGKVAAKTGDITENADGTVDAGTNPNALTTAQDVADAINAAGHKVKGSNSTTQVTANDGSVVIKTGKQLEIEAGKNLELAMSDDGKIQLSTSSKVEFDEVKVGPVTIGENGIDAGNTKITGVAAGTDDTDAVNFAQIKAISNSIADTFGGKKVVNADGTVSTEFEVPGLAGGPFDNVGDALKGLGAELDKGHEFQGDLADASDADGFIKRKHGERLDIRGGVEKLEDLASDPNIGVETFSDDTMRLKLAKNLRLGEDGSVGFEGTTLDATGLVIKDGPKVTKTDVDMSGLQIKGVKAGEEGTDAVNVDQLNAAIKESKTEVEAGTNIKDVVKKEGKDGKPDVYTINAKGTTASAGSDAVIVKAGQENADNVTDFAIDLSDTTKASLKKADSALQEIKTTVNGQDVKTLNQGDNTQNFVDGDNIEITNDNGSIKVSTADEVTFTKVTVGDTEMTTDGMTIKGGPSVTKTGINAGSKEIKGVADGTTPDAAINLSQLEKAAAKATTVVESADDNHVVVTSETAPDKPTTYKVDVKTTDLTVEDTGRVSIDGNNENLVNAQQITKAINESSFNVTSTTAANPTMEKVKAGETVTFDAGKNMKIVQTGKVFVYETKDEVEFTKVTSDEVAVQGVVIDKDGINAGNKKVVGVEDGEISANSKEAVNGSQLHATNEKVKSNKADIDANKTGIEANEQSIAENDKAIKANKAEIDKGLSFVGNDASTVINKKLGQTLAIEGGLGQGKDASAENLRVDVENDKLMLKLSRDLMGLNSVVLGTQKGADVVSLSQEGINAGNKKVTNVADGVDKKDAVNVGQLDAKVEELNKQVAAATTVVAQGKHAVVTPTKGADGENIYTIDGRNIEAGSDAVAVVENDADNKFTVDLGDKTKETLKKADAGFNITGDVAETSASDQANKKDNVELTQDIKFTGGDRENIITTVSNNEIKFDLGDTITVGHANKGGKPVVINGEQGEITGLENTTFDPKATYGDKRAATEEQLKSAYEKGLEAAKKFADSKTFGLKDSTGNVVEKPVDNVIDVVGADSNISTVVEDDKLKIKLSDTLSNMKKVDFVDNQGNASIVIDGDAKKISGLADHLAPADGKTSMVKPTDLATTGQDAATLNDVMNAGWNLEVGGEAKDLVTAADTVNFVGKGPVTVTHTTDNGKNNIEIGIKQGHLETDAQGNVVAKPETDGFVTTEEVAKAINGSGFNLSTNGTDAKLVKSGNKVDMKNTDGNVVISKKDIVEGGKVVGQEVNYDLAKEITVDKVTAKKGLTIGEGDKAITLAPVDTTNVNGINNQPALDLGGKSITGLVHNLKEADGQTAMTKPVDNEINKTNAATVNDVLNSGFNVQANGEAKDFVKAYDTVNFVDGNMTKVDVTSDGIATKIKVDVDTSQLPVVYTDKDGNKVAKKDGHWYKVNPDGSLDTTQVKPEDVKATMQSPTGDTTTGTKLTNVAPAEISDDSKDAVNGSQLKKVADTLGLEVNDDKDGFKAPVLTALKDKKGNDIAAPTTIVAAVNGLSDKVNEGFNFGASNATKGNQQLGSSLVVVASDKVDGKKYVTDNLRTEYVKDADGNGTITISMKESPVFKDVTADKVTAKEVVADNVTIGSVVINKDTGINAGNHKITNVTDGTIAENSKDAVNGGQLWNVEKNLANKISDVAGDLSEVRKSAITFEGNEGKSDQSLTSIFQIVGGIDKDSKVKTSSKNIKTVVTPRKENEKTGKLEIQMSENPVFNSVQFGDNGPTISSIVDANGQSAINMGGSRVTGVAAGVADTDAVNVGQLKQTAAALDKKIKKAGAGAAAAMAAAGLPQPYDPGASVVSAAVGQYGLNAGFAVGISTITDNGRWIIKGSMATDTQLNFGSNVGVGYQW